MQINQYIKKHNAKRAERIKALEAQKTAAESQRDEAQTAINILLGEENTEEVTDNG